MSSLLQLKMLLAVLLDLRIADKASSIVGEVYWV